MQYNPMTQEQIGHHTCSTVVVCSNEVRKKKKNIPLFFSILTRIELTNATSKMVGATLKTRAESIKLMPL